MNQKEKFEHAKCCLDAARFYLNAAFGEGVDSNAEYLKDLQSLLSSVDSSQGLARKIIRQIA